MHVGGARYEDGNVRAASEGIVEPCGVGTSEYRLRYVVESLGNPHAYPPIWRSGLPPDAGDGGAQIWQLSGVVP